MYIIVDVTMGRNARVSFGCTESVTPSGDHLTVLVNQYLQIPVVSYEIIEHVF